MVPTPDDPHNGARATIREVMALVEQARRDVIAELKQLETKVDGRFANEEVKREAALTAHDDEHRREEDRKAGRLRWAVTTIMTGAGVLLGLVIAIWGK